MNISIIAVGKIKEKYLREGIAEYQKRLSRYCTLEIIEVDDESAPENLSPALEDRVKKTEAQRILKNIRLGSFVVVMDVKGKRLSSQGFAHKIEDLGLSGRPNVCFIIGGSLGIHEDVVGMADFKFSMSDLTYTHQMARLLLVEQIYRAFKIMRGEPYSK